MTQETTRDEAMQGMARELAREIELRPMWALLSDTHRLARELRELLDDAEGRFPLPCQSAIGHCINEMRKLLKESGA